MPNAVKKELKSFAENLAMIRGITTSEVLSELREKYSTIFKNIMKKLSTEDEEEWHMITLMQLKGDPAYKEIYKTSQNGGNFAIVVGASDVRTSQSLNEYWYLAIAEPKSDGKKYKIKILIANPKVEQSNIEFGCGYNIKSNISKKGVAYLSDKQKWTNPNYDVESLNEIMNKAGVPRIKYIKDLGENLSGTEDGYIIKEDWFHFRGKIVSKYEGTRDDDSEFCYYRVSDSSFTEDILDSETGKIISSTFTIFSPMLFSFLEEGDIADFYGPTTLKKGTDNFPEQVNMNAYIIKKVELA